MTPDDHDTLYGSPGLYEYGDEQTIESGEPADVPADADSADRHLRLAARARGQKARLEDLFDREIARLYERRQAAVDPLDREIRWRETAVEQWHRREFAAKRVGKSVTLPHGSSALRKAQPKVEVSDPGALLAWAEGRGLVDRLFLPRERPPSLSAIKKLLDVRPGEPGETVPLIDRDTSEVVPGVVAVHRHDTASISEGDDR